MKKSSLRIGIATLHLYQLLVLNSPTAGLISSATTPPSNPTAGYRLDLLRSVLRTRPPFRNSHYSEKSAHEAHSGLLESASKTKIGSAAKIPVATTVVPSIAAHKPYLNNHMC